jgi:hypothetical protein
VRKAIIDQNLLASSNLREGLSAELKNKINEHDSVQNFELSYFPHDYLLAFKEMNTMQKVRKQLFKVEENI